MNEFFVYTDFSKAFDRVLHGLLKSNLLILFGGSLLCWMGSYLTGRTQLVKLEDYWSESIQCHSGISRGSHLGPIFFILDINAAFDIFENVSVLGYADDLKLFMTIKCVGDCQLFQRDLDRLGEWCRSKKFDLNAGKCKSIFLRRNMRLIEFVYSINGTTLERVDEIKDLGVIMDGKMSFLRHIEAIIISKSSRILGFIKRISRDFRDPYTHKTLYTSLVRPNLEHAACVWSPHQSVHSERLERVQQSFIRYAVRRLPWRVWPLPAYDARRLLMGREVLSDRRIFYSALFARDILVGRVDCPDLALMLRFEEVP
jgi:hypothetical protein